MFDRNLCGGDPAKQAEYWYNVAMTATCTDAELRRVRAAWKKDREENEELRELVKALWHLLHEWLFKRGEVSYNELDTAYESMRELGIEVE